MKNKLLITNIATLPPTLTQQSIAWDVASSAPPPQRKIFNDFSDKNLSSFLQSLPDEATALLISKQRLTLADCEKLAKTLLSKNIVALGCRNMQIDKIGFKILCSAIHISNKLKSLNLDNVTINHLEFVRLISALDQHQSLKYLDIYQCMGIANKNISTANHTKIIFSNVKTLSLEYLSLQNNGLGTKDIGWISKFLVNEYSPTYISLAYNPLGNDMAEALAGYIHLITSTVSLNLEGTNITTKGAKKIVGAISKNDLMLNLVMPKEVTQATNHTIQLQITSNQRKLVDTFKEVAKKAIVHYETLISFTRQLQFLQQNCYGASRNEYTDFITGSALDGSIAQLTKLEQSQPSSKPSKLLLVTKKELDKLMKQSLLPKTASSTSTSSSSSVTTNSKTEGHTLKDSEKIRQVPATPRTTRPNRAQLPFSPTHQSSSSSSLDAHEDSAPVLPKKKERKEEGKWAERVVKKNKLVKSSSMPGFS
jgi:hypothetical protein